MADFKLSKKEIVVLFVEVLLSSAFFGFLCLIELSLYLKLTSAFIIIFLLWAWAFWVFKKKEKRHDLLIKEQETKGQRYLKLTELATQICRASLSPQKGANFSSGIKLFLREFFNSSRFLLFAKKGNVYQMITASNIDLAERKRLFLKQNSEFLSVLKSLDGSTSLEFVDTSRMPSVLSSLQKEAEFNLIVPLGTSQDLWGFVLLKSDGSPADAEQRLASIISNQLGLNLQKEDLLVRLKGTEKKFAANLSQSRAELATLNKDSKRRIFDLNAILGMVNNLYSIAEEERLFSVFSKMLQDHLGAKSVLVMLPEEKTDDVVARHSLGVQLGNLQDLRIEKGKGLHSWIRNEKELWFLYDMRKLSEERVLRKLLSSGFQIGAKLSFTRDRFGLILLGERADGSKYRQIDLQILAILVSMVGTAYKNIKHYSSIEELSYTDSMTGLYNYRYFYKRLTEEVFRAKRFSRKLALAIFDIDDFKIYNDTYGHQAGDQVLKQLGELLLQTVRSIDVVSRYGGDEFCVIMPESDQDECIKFMERLRKAIVNHCFKDENMGLEHNITVSLGAAIYPHDARTVDRIIYRADMALLTAKNLGRNKSVMYADRDAALKAGLSHGEPVKIIDSVMYVDQTDASKEKT